MNDKIIKAVFEGKIGELKSILKTHNVDLDAVLNSVGSPLIHVAAAAGHTHMVLELIELGVNVNLENALGVTALDIAYTNAYAYIARALLDNGGIANLANAPAQDIVFNNIAGNHGNGDHYWEDADKMDEAHEYTCGGVASFCGGETF